MSDEDNLLKAVSTIFEALNPLSEEARSRALASVRALLGMEPERMTSSAAFVERADDYEDPPASRPPSLVELIEQHHPTTNPQFIAMFAYYRERFEGTPRFARKNLKPYFPKARLAPPSNYDRDFGTAVKHGWIHEDGSESYLTTRGIEAVESAFTAATPATAKRSTKRRPAKKPRARATNPSSPTRSTSN